MRFGLELRFEGDDDDLARVARLAEIGYQYVHLSVDCLRCGAEPEAYYAVRRSLNRAAVRPEVFSWAMPPGMPLVGDDVHWPATEKHLALALERIEETGGQVLAFPAKPPTMPAPLASPWVICSIPRKTPMSPHRARRSCSGCSDAPRYACCWRGHGVGKAFPRSLT